MNAIATYQPTPGHKPSPDLSALLDAVRSNVAIMPRDLTAQRVAEARALAAASVQPATPELIVAWLKKLAMLVVNGPDAGRARAQAEAMVEICGDLPAAVWCPETRKAWCQQGDKGKFWPAPPSFTPTSCRTPSASGGTPWQHNGLWPCPSGQPSLGQP